MLPPNVPDIFCDNDEKSDKEPPHTKNEYESITRNAPTIAHTTRQPKMLVAPLLCLFSEQNKILYDEEIGEERTEI